MSGGEQHPSLWDYPELYELLHLDPARVEAEVAAIAEILGDNGIRSGRLLEIGCGPAAHSLGLAQRGFSVCGLDRSEAMLQRARERAEAEGVRMPLYSREAVDFRLPEDAFDGALFMSETFPLLRTDEALQSHFASVRAALRPGGLYIIDLDRCTDGVGSDRSASEPESAVTADGTRVEYWLESHPGDWVVGSGHLQMVCRFSDGERTVETRDEWTPRRDCPTHLTWLIRSLPDWDLVGFYSPVDGTERIEDLDHYFMVARAV